MTDLSKFLPEDHQDHEHNGYFVEATPEAMALFENLMELTHKLQHSLDVREGLILRSRKGEPGKIIAACPACLRASLVFIDELRPFVEDMIKLIDKGELL